MDSWSDSHIKAMRHGGNKKCRNYLKNQGLDLSACSIRERYESPVAKKYHQKLKTRMKSVTENHPVMVMPSGPLNLDLSSKSSSALDSSCSNHSRQSIMSVPARLTKRFSRHAAPPSIRRGSIRTQRRSASAPTIVYLGRSFKANSPESYANAASEDTLQIADDVEAARKLEQIWYDDTPSCTQSYASTSLSSASNSLSSYFSSSGSSTGSFYNGQGGGTELSIKDLNALHKDPQVGEYVRQQLMQHWKGNPKRSDDATGMATWLPQWV